jgi:hypothetical protein
MVFRRCFRFDECQLKLINDLVQRLGQRLRFYCRLRSAFEGEQYISHQMLVVAFADCFEDEEFVEEMMDVLRNHHAQ